MRNVSTRSVRRLLRASALLSVLAATAAAQHPVAGVVIEMRSKRALPCVEVSLLDSTGAVHAITRTSLSGEFRFEQTSVTASRIRIWAQGLLPYETSILVGAATGDVLHRYPLVLRPRSTGLDAPRDEGREDYVPPVPIMGKRLPRFPDELRGGGARGTVIVGFAIDPEGRIDETTVFDIHSSHPAFRRSVLSALPYQRYQPALDNGTAVCAFVVWPFEFR